jgi:hypothetical protein
MVILVVRLRFLPGVKVLKQRLGGGAPVERMIYKHLQAGR